MPTPTIKFDVTRKARVINNAQGITIWRQCITTGIGVSPGLSDPSVLLKCLKMKSSPRFPQVGDGHPDPDFATIPVVEQQIESFDTHTDTVDATIIYRGVIPDDSGGGGIFFTLTQGGQASTIDVYSSAGNAQTMTIFYDPNAAQSAIVPVTPPGETELNTRAVSAHKIIVSDVLKASATVTAQQLADNLDNLRAMKGRINGTNWGPYARGTWLALSPTTRNLDSAGLTWFLELTFLNKDPDWYSIHAWRDIYHNIPRDIVSEADVRGAGLPAVGGGVRRRGISLWSIYEEFDPTVLNFAPR